MKQTKDDEEEYNYQKWADSLEYFELMRGR